MDRLSCAVNWKAAGDGDDPSGSLVGYASTYGGAPDRQGDVVDPGAFAASIADINAAGLPLLADHDPSTRSVLGTIYAAEDEPTGLRITARLASTSKAQDVRRLLVEGHLSRLSIGYETVRDRWEGKVRHIVEARLWEVSAVVFPANPDARVLVAKSAGGPVVDDLALSIAIEELALDLARLGP